MKSILESWGSGKYDAEVKHDGKAFGPDGKSGAMLLPAAFGLAGVNPRTYTGRIVRGRHLQADGFCD